MFRQGVRRKKCILVYVIVFLEIEMTLTNRQREQRQWEINEPLVTAIKRNKRSVEYSAKVKVPFGNDRRSHSSHLDCFVNGCVGIFVNRILGRDAADECTCGSRVCLSRRRDTLSSWVHHQQHKKYNNNHDTARRFFLPSDENKRKVTTMRWMF